ncbi:hypothetical protein [Acinetobacter sp. YH12151]|uniref:hypothetical protein n=1 Tax=Acinetobacter sp. YH12151 TaxID=2601131 RepID=UPI0015D1E09D|nr:hypothetical protein [Acinetobacter sp. YH12151]
MCNHQVFRTMRFPVNSRQMHKQAGFASILLILLIGLALTTLVIGMVTSVRSLQDSSLTTHAQTQAQIKSAIGYQALTGLLKPLSATQIAQINNGVIKDNGSPAATIATYKVVTTTEGCPASTGGKNYFCYDITAKSGGASSVVRAIYTEITTGGGAFDGSIFAGGLQVGHEINLQGNQTIQVGDAGKGSGIVKGNGNNYYTVEDFLDGTGFTVKPYQPTTFLTAEELRPSSNYIFYANGKCAKNNLYGPSIYNTETAPVTCSSISGITVSGSGASKKWTIDAASSAIPAGVLWFEGEVDINLKSSRDLVNTIIATGDMQVITTNQGGAGKAYAPYPYYLESSTDLTTKKARICGSSATGIPTQYCDTTGTLKTIDTERTKISNILFFSDKTITFEVKNNSPMSLYGNIMGSGGAGGTGASSGKFNGTGNIDIKGNLTFTGKGITTTNGSVNVKLNNGSSGGSATPAQKVMTLSGLRYM